MRRKKKRKGTPNIPTDQAGEKMLNQPFTPDHAATFEKQRTTSNLGKSEEREQEGESIRENAWELRGRSGRKERERTGGKGGGGKGGG